MALVLQFASNVIDDPWTPVDFPRFLVAPDEDALIEGASRLLDGCEWSLGPCVLIVAGGKMLDKAARPYKGNDLSYVGDVALVS